MNLSSRLRVILCFVLPALLVFACTPAQAPSPTDTPEPVPPTPTPTLALAEITFDGERCQYERPELVSEGELGFVFSNVSDTPSAHLHVNLLVGVATWEDILDLAAEGPIKSPPPGIREMFAVSVSREDDLEVYALKPGTYAVLCVIHSVNAWPTTAIEVES